MKGKMVVEEAVCLDDVFDRTIQPQTLWMDAEGKAKAVRDDLPYPMPCKEARRRALERWRRLAGLPPLPPPEEEGEEEGDEGASPPSVLATPPKASQRSPSVSVSPGKGNSKSTQDEAHRVFPRGGRSVCGRCGSSFTNGERRALAHWVTRCMRDLSRMPPPSAPEGGWPDIVESEGAGTRTVATQDTLTSRSALPPRPRPKRQPVAPPSRVVRKASLRSVVTGDFEVHMVSPSRLPSPASSPASEFVVHHVDDLSLAGDDEELDYESVGEAQDFYRHLAEKEMQLNRIRAILESEDAKLDAIGVAVASALNRATDGEAFEPPTGCRADKLSAIDDMVQQLAVVSEDSVVDLCSSVAAIHRGDQLATPTHRPEQQEAAAPAPPTPVPATEDVTSVVEPSLGPTDTSVNHPPPSQSHSGGNTGWWFTSLARTVASALGSFARPSPRPSPPPPSRPTLVQRAAVVTLQRIARGAVARYRLRCSA
eukprot:Sspe_Gene.6668::Locus_2245_Transcript_2_2_Confidence_0.667_Length_1529::g.6668::m.6668